jgi:hypothetical protein
MVCEEDGIRGLCVMDADFGVPDYVITLTL